MNMRPGHNHMFFDEEINPEGETSWLCFKVLNDALLDVFNMFFGGSGFGGPGFATGFGNGFGGSPGTHFTGFYFMLCKLTPSQYLPRPSVGLGFVYDALGGRVNVQQLRAGKDPSWLMGGPYFSSYFPSSRCLPFLSFPVFSRS